MYYYSHITGEEIEQRKLYHLPKITQIRSDEAFKLKDLAPESVILNNRHQHVSMLGRMQSSTLEIWIQAVIADYFLNFIHSSKLIPNFP